MAPRKLFKSSRKIGDSTFYAESTFTEKQRAKDRAELLRKEYGKSARVFRVHKLKSGTVWAVFTRGR